MCSGEFAYDASLDSEIGEFLQSGNVDRLVACGDAQGSIQLRSNHWYMGGPRAPATLLVACLLSLIQGTHDKFRGRVMGQPGRIARAVRAAYTLGPEELACSCEVLAWCATHEPRDEWSIPQSLYAFAVLSGIMLLGQHGARRLRKVSPVVQLDASTLNAMAEQLEALIPQDAAYWLNDESAALARLDFEGDEYAEWWELASLVLEVEGDELSAARRVAAMAAKGAA